MASTSNLVFVHPSAADIMAPTSRECLDCDRTFKTPAQLRLHRVKTHREVNNVADSAILHGRGKVTTAVPVYLCPETDCVFGAHQSDYYFKKMSNLKAHYQSMHCNIRRTYACSLCSQRFDSVARRKQHMAAECEQRQTDTVEFVLGPDATLVVKVKDETKKTHRKRKIVPPDAQRALVPHLPKDEAQAPSLIVVQVNNEAKPKEGNSDMTSPQSAMTSPRRIAPKARRLDATTQAFLHMSSSNTVRFPTPMRSVGCDTRDLAAMDVGTSALSSTSLVQTAPQQHVLCQTYMPFDSADACLVTEIRAPQMDTRGTDPFPHSLDDLFLDSLDPTRPPSLGHRETQTELDSIDLSALLGSPELDEMIQLSDIQTQTHDETVFAQDLIETYTQTLPWPLM